MPSLPRPEESRKSSLNLHQPIRSALTELAKVQYERKSPAYRKLVAESKYEKWPAFGELPEGPILLQDHGNEVSFRNIKIKVLR